MKYTCKLCDETYQTEEDLFSHRIGEYHHSLSKAVSDQFLLEVGNSCEECSCSVIQTPEETFYSFCEIDDHYESFVNIWSNFKNHGVVSADVNACRFNKFCKMIRFLEDP